MTELLLRIEPELKHRLEDAATRAGLPLDDYVMERLNLLTEPEPRGNRIEPLGSPESPEESEPPYVGETPGEMILRMISELTEEERRALPSDLSENHDHYIYGTPKRKPEL